MSVAPTLVLSVREVETTADGCLEPLPNPIKFEKRAGEAERQAWKRQRADVEAEYNAVRIIVSLILCVVLMGGLPYPGHLRRSLHAPHELLAEGHRRAAAASGAHAYATPGRRLRRQRGLRRW